MEFSRYSFNLIQFLQCVSYVNKDCLLSRKLHSVIAGISPSKGEEGGGSVVSRQDVIPLDLKKGEALVLR